MSKKYKAIYQCRLCGKKFEDKVRELNTWEYETSSLCIEHKCDDGGYGVSDLIGAYEVNE